MIKYFYLFKKVHLLKHDFYTNFQLMLSFYLDLVKMTKSVIIHLNDTLSPYPSFSCDPQSTASDNVSLSTAFTMLNQVSILFLLSEEVTVKIDV